MSINDIVCCIKYAVVSYRTCLKDLNVTETCLHFLEAYVNCSKSLNICI